MSSTVVNIGPPPPGSGFNLKEYNAVVHVHNFASRPGNMITSPKFSCAGREWVLEINPKNSYGSVEIYLKSKFRSTITVDYDISVKGYSATSNSRVKFPADESSWRNSRWSVSRRKTLNNALDDNGTFSVYVRIRPRDDAHGDTNPDSKICSRIVSNLMKNENDADVTFDVKGQLLYAHTIILKERAPDLVTDFCDACDKSNPIPIQDVQPEVFKAMLQHAYAHNISPSMWKDHTKEILEASGKYGFNELKSEAEALYLKSEITVDNVIDKLLYADSYNLSMLKKAAMDFIVKHGGEVMASDSYDRLDESPKLRKEVMSAAFESSRKRQRAGD